MDEVKNYPPYLDYPKPYKAKTNAESIRALSDEDLANFLIGFSWLAENGVKICYKTIDKWLQQPAEVGLPCRINLNRARSADGK